MFRILTLENKLYCLLTNQIFIMPNCYEPQDPHEPEELEMEINWPEDSGHTWSDEELAEFWRESVETAELNWELLGLGDQWEVQEPWLDTDDDPPINDEFNLLYPARGA
jgi:hypothetical protein